MNRRICLCILFVTAAFIVAPWIAESAIAEDSASIKAIFANPPRQYSSGPLWVWNDMLTEEQIVSTLEDLASQKVKQAWVHPRPGLMTPYLSDDWFRLWRVALREAERLDMNIWIYDENSYPSGFAGGLVPEAMPESRGRGLHMHEVKTVGKIGSDVLAVYRLTNDSFENVTAIAKQQGDLPAGRYLVATIRLAPTGGWFGGKYYVDLLHPGVTDKFIEITMGAYKREIGQHFGKRVPGVFTDEPHMTPAGGIHWSERLPADFRTRWGYDLMDHLPSLIHPIGDWKRVRHNYQQFILEEFINCWAKPFYEYCEEHNLEFTGHYWEHGWPGASHGGDNMAMYAWHQRPAIDNLMNEYHEDTHAQFGNARTVRELASVANQLGRKRTLCETYGAGGWDLRFEDMKRIGDWIYVLGVNTLNEHLSYITIRGARKRDHPQSFSYHTPWWEAYHVMAEYFTRLSLALSSGEQINDVLVIQPTTTAWMYQPDRSTQGQLNAVGNAFQDMINELERQQVEYDIGCEDIMGRNGSVKGSHLRVGQRDYRTVVLTPHTENLNAETMDLLEKFTAAGGVLLCCGEPPARISGAVSDRGQKLKAGSGFKQVDANAIPSLLRTTANGQFAIHRRTNDKGILFHQRRKLDDGELLFLVNTSIDAPTAGLIVTAAQGVEEWDLRTGGVKPYAFISTRGTKKAQFSLPPCGSLLLFLSNKPLATTAAVSYATSTIKPVGSTEIRRVEPNVLTLDYVDVTAGGKTRKNVYVYGANRFVFQQHAMDRNPWDSAVQFRDQLITKTFPADSGFEASYHFVIEGQTPKSLYAVVERPDLYTVTINGKPVAADKGQWWLDKSFGKIDIAAAVREGANQLTIAASPMTIFHELESAYLLGDFSLKTADSGFIITPPKPLDMGARNAHVSNPDGTMWLTAGVGFDKSRPVRTDRRPYLIFDLGAIRNLAQVKVWNYNEVNLTSRGVKRLRISGSAADSDGPFDVDLGTHLLDQAASGSAGPTNSPRFPQSLDVAGDPVRFVKFDILSNHNDVLYPADDGTTDNAFVGLSEVKLYENSGLIGNVKVVGVSSELTNNFDRLAKYLVNDAGLDAAGWNAQGMPFYASGVSYVEVFNVSQATGRYFVELPAWYGSVTKVLVEGKLAGYITNRPWQCDITDLVKPGSNRIEVIVFGTLKNTLGPHHAGAVVGKAWPNMFHNGPEPGPPPGAKYHTLAYGLFQPFLVKHVVPR